MAARLRIVSVPHAAAQASACDAAVRSLLASGEPVARIAPSSARAALTARRLADEGAFTLGVPSTTLDRWALDRWALYGDGRRPVTGAQRRAVVMRALDTARAAHLATALPGMVACVEDAVRTGAGSPAFEGALESGGARLSPAERELLDMCRTYGALLRDDGLLEAGSAMAGLAATMGDAGWAHLVLEGFSSLGDAEAALVVAAAAHRGATFVAELGDGPAGEAARLLAGRLEASCRDAGVAVERVDDAGDPHAPWTSGEIALLAGRLYRAGARKPIEATGDVRFCLPSGRYAEPELVARSIEALLREGIPPRGIAVACADPLGMADTVAPRLRDGRGRSVACRAQGGVPLTETGLGRLVAALVPLVERERDRGSAPAPELRSFASDAARSPLSGISVEDALDLDRTWRGDRTASARSMLRDLCEAAARGSSEGAEGADPLPDRMAPLAQAITRLREGDLSEACALLVAPLGGDAPADRLERSAGALLARYAAADRSLNPERAVASAHLSRLVSGLKVPTSWVCVSREDLAAQSGASVLESNPNAVEFCTYGQLSGRAFDAVVACDLTAEAASVGERSDALGALFDALGVHRGPTTLQNQRRLLMDAVEASRSRIVFERCLQDPEAKGLRPSALFEEVVDCYRADPTSLEDLDRITGLPRDGSLPSSTLGEERFAELASPSLWTPASVPSPSSGIQLRPDVARSLYLCDDHSWTPSDLEVYLSCPLRWFYECRLPSKGIDAAFGPREMGSFSRRVLRTFHEAMAKRGTPRVRGGNDRPEWEPVLDACFSEALEQRAGSNPLVPVTPLEHERLETVRRNLIGCIERDALMPAGFVPTDHEWSFGDREPLVFGGIRLHGTVDRIDEDDAGHALIIGYRGAVGDDYNAPRAKRGQDPEEVDRLPQHCQALIYAAALQRLRPGTLAVGALYVSYNRARVKGFLDGSASCLSGFELVEDGMVGRTEDGKNGFQDLLSYLEQEVGEAMDRLRDGDTSPRPRFGARSCAYCSVTGCPKRRA